MSRQKGRRIISKVHKMLFTLSVVIFSCGASVAQVPPQDQRSLPKAPQPKQLTLSLDVDFKINSGAASTKERSVSLNFTAREKSGASNFEPRDLTASVTQYRVLESEGSGTDLSSQPWIQITNPKLRFELSLRDATGRRYGERRVLFQVKNEALTSSVVSDTIIVEPTLKEYRVSASNSAAQPHPLLKYASDQGFTFPLDFYETCKGSCFNVDARRADPSLASGTATVTAEALSKPNGPQIPGLPPPADVPAGTCVTKADYLMFEGRDLNPFWKIKSVNVTGASVHPHGVNRFRLKSTASISDGRCLPGYQIVVGDIVVEGPDVDDFVDSANPWKNAFVRQQSGTRP